MKLVPADFDRAHTALGKYYQSQLENMDADYYLLSFTNEELLEQVYLYPKNERRHGKRILTISTIIFIYWLWAFLSRGQ